MPMLQSLLVIFAAAVFAVFLLVQMRPGTFAFARPGKLLGLRPLLDRAREASTPRSRAEALCEAGDLAFRDPRHHNAALGYYLRAMRTDPVWETPIDKVGQMLARRPRALERVLWKRLGSIAWEGETRASAAKIAEVLSSSRARRTVTKAQRDVLVKLSGLLKRA